MTIAVATLHNYLYKDLADHTFIKNLEPYCNLHGYKLICKNKDLPEDRRIYFEKIKIMRDAMEDSSIEWIWWLDCDAIVTNFHIKLESIIDLYFFITTLLLKSFSVLIIKHPKSIIVSKYFCSLVHIKSFKSFTEKSP